MSLDCQYCERKAVVYMGTCAACVVRRIARLTGREAAENVRLVRASKGDAAAEQFKAALAAERGRLAEAGQL